MNSSAASPFNFSICQAADLDEMTQLLAEVFSQRDPPALAVGLTPSEFEAFVRLLCPKAQAEGLTIIARSIETGEIVGALLAEDSASAAPDGFERLSAKFNPIFDILGQLDFEYRTGRTLRPGESVHLFLLGVSERFGGKGIAQQLVIECLANAARKGYGLAITEATNKTSQHIFRKQGFVERVRRSYSKHRFQEKAFFLSVAEHGGPILMEKRLTPSDVPVGD